MTVGSKEYFPIPLKMFKKVGSITVPPGTTMGTELLCGQPVCEYQWSAIGGTKVRDLLNNDAYPKKPTKMIALTSGTFSMQMVKAPSLYSQRPCYAS